MAFNFNGNIPQKIIYNNNNVAKLKYNNVIVWKGLPNTYQEVEYIQSSGTQYIDTGIYDVDKVKVKFVLLEWKAYVPIFGNYISEGTDCTRLIGQDSQGSGCYANASSKAMNPVFGYHFTLDTVHTYIIEHSASTVTLSEDGNVNSTPRVNGNINTTNIALFSNKVNPSGTLTKAKIYLWRAYKGGVVVRDMIPCYRKSDNEVGLYDINNSGKNIFDKNSVTYFQAWISELNKWNYSADSKSFRVPVQPNTTYTISASNPSETIFRAGWTSSENTPTSASQVNLNDCYRYTNTNTPITMTTGAEAKYIVIQLSSANIDTTIQTLQIEEGNSATSYEPYPFYTNSGTGEFTVGPDIN